MAKAFTNAIRRVEGGITIERWFTIQSQLDGFNMGGEIIVTDRKGVEKIIPRNQAVLVLNDRKCLSEGVADKNHGNGGSNSVAGNPLAFMDSKDVYVDAFLKRNLIDGEKGEFYTIPLNNINDYPSHRHYMADSTAQFIMDRRGGNEYDEPNIANGLACVLQSICYRLSCEITLNGKKPDTKRIFFLVNALREMSIVAQNAAKYSSDIRNVLEVLPFAANSADTLQSIIMCFLFNKTPCEAILINWIGLILKRHRRYSGRNSRFSDPKTPATGIYACILIVPMIADLIAADLDNKEVVGSIVAAINTAIDSTVEALASADHALTPHEENKLVMTCFVEATNVKLVKANLISRIYDCVVDGKTDDFAQHMGIAVDPDFINPGVLIMSNKKLPTFALPVLHDEKENTVTFAPGNVREWTGIHLNPRNKYELGFANMGPGEFKTGNTQGQTNVANARFTSGLDIMGFGFASSRMQCNRQGKRFTPLRYNIQFTMAKTFIIDCTEDGIHVLQDDVELYHLVPDAGFAGRDMCPTISFKFCTVTVKVLREDFPKPIAAPIPEQKEVPPPSYEDAMVRPPGGPSAAAEPEDVPAILSLADRIAQLRLTRPKSAFSKKASASFKDSDEKSASDKDLFKNGVPEGFPFHDE